MIFYMTCLFEDGDKLNSFKSHDIIQTNLNLRINSLTSILYASVAIIVKQRTDNL